jgi:phosphopantothenoylcysteine decarboxylase/phosphopantothenate--cysteine ligase
MSQTHDLFVARRSNTLRGKTLDIAVSGSIAAMESPRFLRSLRRLGAEVVPWLSAGGSQFITETSLSWASGGKKVIQHFSGEAPHIAVNDALIIAPASANILSKISIFF